VIDGGHVASRGLLWLRSGRYLFGRRRAAHSTGLAYQLLPRPRCVRLAFQVHGLHEFPLSGIPIQTLAAPVSSPLAAFLTARNS
jgi:hypothetical protein